MNTLFLIQKKTSIHWKTKMQQRCIDRLDWRMFVFSWNKNPPYTVFTMDLVRSIKIRSDPAGHSHQPLIALRSLFHWAVLGDPNPGWLFERFFIYLFLFLFFLFFVFFWGGVYAFRELQQVTSHTETNKGGLTSNTPRTIIIFLPLHKNSTTIQTNSTHWY